MDRFLFVKPNPAKNPLVEKWVSGEFQHALEHWRRQFRGEIVPRHHSYVTDRDIAECNLILWGDPGSNRVIKKIADKLPIKWDGATVQVGGKSYSAEKHVPVLIYPNPLNPTKYVVLNSSFTYREYDYLNNARQVPKLPDWAVLDVSQPPTSRTPAGIVDAGFFDEYWRLTK